MRPDLDYVQRKFQEFNSLFFGGTLPPLPLRLSNSVSNLGAFVFPRKYKDSMPRGAGECFMRISSRLDLPEIEVENTIIHEMIHYYIWCSRIKDDAPHGKEFLKKMHEINTLYGRDISVRYTGNGSEKDTDQLVKAHFICITKLASGGRGITVCAQSRIFEINAAFKKSSQIKKLEWFWSADPWFNRFPTVRTPKIFVLEDEDYKNRLANAMPCRCEPHKFGPKEKAK